MMALYWLVPVILLVLGESIVMVASTPSANATSLPLDSVEEEIPPRRHPLTSLEPMQAKSIFADATRNPLRRTTLAPATNAASLQPSSRRARSPTPELSVSFETDRILDDIDRAGDAGAENLLPPISQQVLFQPSSADRHDPQKQLLEKPDKTIFAAAATTTTTSATTAILTTTTTPTTTTTTSTRASATTATVLPIEVAPATIATNIVDGEVVKWSRVQWNFIDPAVQFLKRLRSRAKAGKVRTKRDKFSLDGQPIIRSGSTNSGRAVSSEEREVVEREQLSILPKLVPLTTTTTTTVAPTSPKPKPKKKVARPSRPVPAKKKGNGRRPAAIVVAVPAKKKEIVPDGRQRVTVTGGDFRQDLPPTNAANDKNIEESFNPSAGLKPTTVTKKTPSPPSIAPPSPRPRPTPPTPSTLQPDRFVLIGGRRFILRTIPSQSQPTPQQLQFPQQPPPQLVPQLLQQPPPQPFFPQWQSPPNPQPPLFPPQPFFPKQPSLPQQFFVPPQQQPFVPTVPPRLLPPPQRVQVVTPRQAPAVSQNRALIPTSTEPTTLSPDVEEETLVPLHELITTTRGSTSRHLKVWNGDFYDEVGGFGGDEPPPPSDPAQHTGSVRRSRKHDTNVGDAGTGAVIIETSGRPVHAASRKIRSTPQLMSASADSDDDDVFDEE